MKKKDTVVKNTTKNKNIQPKKKNIELKNNMLISWQMYTKWVHLIKKEELEYLKNSPFKNKVKFL